MQNLTVGIPAKSNRNKKEHKTNFKRKIYKKFVQESREDPTSEKIKGINMKNKRVKI